MKTLLKNLLKLENLTGKAGIQRNEGRKIVRRKGNSRTNKINVATLAYQMEKFVSWIQSKDTYVRNKDGKILGFIKAGTRLERQARPFIHFNENAEVYNNFKAGVRTLVRKFALNKFRNPKSLMMLIVEFAVDAQKFIIINKKTGHPNKPLTVMSKGYDHPLKDTGTLLNSIKGKVDALKGSVVKVLKNHDIERLNKIYKDLGGKA